MFLICLIGFIKGACVENVLDSVVSALLADENRKFIYVEQVIIRFILFILFCLVVNFHHLKRVWPPFV